MAEKLLCFKIFDYFYAAFYLLGIYNNLLHQIKDLCNIKIYNTYNYYSLNIGYFL